MLPVVGCKKKGGVLRGFDIVPVKKRDNMEFLNTLLQYLCTLFLLLLPLDPSSQIRLMMLYMPCTLHLHLHYTAILYARAKYKEYNRLPSIHSITEQYVTIQYYTRKYETLVY